MAEPSPIIKSMPGSTAGDLQYQRYTMGLNARGSSLGIGHRVAPSADMMFSHPPISGGQFGNGHAKSIAGEEG